jgi:hypothetical protein
MTLPNTTCSTWSGSTSARSIATRATVAPSSVGGTSRKLRPKEPIAVRTAEVITAPVTNFFTLSPYPTIARTVYRVLLPPCTRAREPLKRLANLAQNRRIIDRRRARVLLAIRDLAHHLPGPRRRSRARPGGASATRGWRAARSCTAQLALVRTDSASASSSPSRDAADRRPHRRLVWAP